MGWHGRWDVGVWWYDSDVIFCVCGLCVGVECFVGLCVCVYVIVWVCVWGCMLLFGSGCMCESCCLGMCFCVCVVL